MINAQYQVEQENPRWGAYGLAWPAILQERQWWTNTLPRQILFSFVK